MSILGNALNRAIAILVAVEADDGLVIETGPTPSGAWTVATGLLWHAGQEATERDGLLPREDLLISGRLVVPAGASLPAAAKYIRVDGVVYSLQSKSGDTIETWDCERADYRSVGADRGADR